MVKILALVAVDVYLSFPLEPILKHLIVHRLNLNLSRDKSILLICTTIRAILGKLWPKGKVDSRAGGNNRFELNEIFQRILQNMLYHMQKKTNIFFISHFVKIQKEKR